MRKSFENTRELAKTCKQCKRGSVSNDVVTSQPNFSEPAIKVQDGGSLSDRCEFSKIFYKNMDAR